MTRYLCDETKTTLDNAFEISIYEEALRHDPENIEVLLVLGHTYTREKMYEKGMETDQRLIARHNYDLGYNVLPTKDKRPLIPWLKWRDNRQALADVQAMPWQNATGLAVVVGKVSGGLTCIDFDKQASPPALSATAWNSISIPFTIFSLVTT